MPTLTGAILVNINKFSLFNTFLFTIFYNWLPNFIPHFLLILFYNISSTLWRENISFNRKGNTEWHTNQTWKKPWVSVKVIKQIISDVDLNISCFSPIFCSAIIFSSQSVIAGGDSDSGDTREHDTTIVWCLVTRQSASHPVIIWCCWINMSGVGENILLQFLWWWGWVHQSCITNSVVKE